MTALGGRAWLLPTPYSFNTEGSLGEMAGLAQRGMINYSVTGLRSPDLRGWRLAAVGVMTVTMCHVTLSLG